METQTETIAMWINRQIDERGWTYAELARRAGVSHVTISNIISGKRNPGRRFCTAIAGPLNVPPEFVMRRAGLLPPLPSDPDEKAQLEWLEQMKRLTPEERLRVIEYARFVEQQRLSGALDTA